MIEVQCPQCGQRYEVGEEFRTRTAKCPQCGGRIPVLPTPEMADFDGAARDEVNRARIKQHLARYLGEPNGLFREVMPFLVPIDLQVIAPRPERNFWTLVTSGMSDRAMLPPESGRDAMRFAELVICLPANWPVGKEEFEREEFFWPVRWLRMLARFPHEHGTWLDLGQTIPNGDPAEPFYSETQLCGWTLARPQLAPPEFFELRVDEARTIRFLAIVALHASEIDLGQREGAVSLLDRFHAAGVNELLQPERESAV